MQSQPSKGALDNPTVRQFAESFTRLGMFDNLNLNFAARTQATDPVDEFAGIAAIGPDQDEAVKAAAQAL